MSCQRGNNQRTRAQKHQNSRAFKNDLHDKTPKMKMINNLEVSGVCSRCKDIIEWKIRYKKYKPLAVPKKCTKCQEKTVLFAYHALCSPCSQSLQLCAKCIQPQMDLQSSLQKISEMEQDIRFLPERKRRTLARLASKGDMHTEKLQNPSDGMTADVDDPGLHSNESDT